MLSRSVEREQAEVTVVRSVFRRQKPQADPNCQLRTSDTKETQQDKSQKANYESPVLSETKINIHKQKKKKLTVCVSVVGTPQRFSLRCRFRFLKHSAQQRYFEW